MTPEEVLGLFRRCGALLEGHFILRSGRHSRQFFQCALLLQYPGLAAQLCEALAGRLDASRFDSVISPAMGGILVGHELARQLDRRHIFVEKHQGRLALRRFEVRPGERFLVAEDVVTTGSAVAETCAIVRGSGGVVTAVAVMVDRSGEPPPNFGVPLISLLKMQVETFDPEHLPEDLRAVPAVKPGSL